MKNKIQMVAVITVSDIDRDPSDLKDKVMKIFESYYQPGTDESKISAIIPLDWDQSLKIVDDIDKFYSSTSFYKSIAKLTKIIIQCNRQDKKLIIISQSTSSILIEIALSIIDNSVISPAITHLMLAPNFDDISAKKISQYGISTIRSLAKSGISSAELSPFWKLIFGSIGYQVVQSSLSDDKMTEILLSTLGSITLSYAKIDRIILNSEDDKLNENVLTDLQGFVRFSGPYLKQEICELSRDGLKQEFRSTHYGTPIELTKQTILQMLVE